MLKQLYKKNKQYQPINAFKCIEHNKKTHSHRYASFLLLLCNLNFFYVSCFEFLDVSCAHENENAVLCFFSTSVVVSVINSAPSIRFCDLRLLIHPCFRALIRKYHISILDPLCLGFQRTHLRTFLYVRMCVAGIQRQFHALDVLTSCFNRCINFCRMVCVVIDNNLLSHWLFIKATFYAFKSC